MVHLQGETLDYDVSVTGTIVYTPALTPMYTLVWRDREGRIVQLGLAPRQYSCPSLSPDGRQVTVSVAQGIGIDVWKGSVDREPLDRVTTNGDSCCSIFSPDGKRLYYSSFFPEEGVYWMNSDDMGAPRRLLEVAVPQKPTAILNGTFLFNEAGPGNRRHIMQVNVNRPTSKTPFELRSTTGSEIEAAVSPDGKWVAYQSDETDGWQIYVRPYANQGPRWRVSPDGGMGPAWNPRGGSELFYQTRTDLMSVRIVNGEPGRPVKLFSCRKSEDYRREFDVDPGGERFLFTEPVTPRTEIRVITNWFEELKRAWSPSETNRRR